MTQPEEHIDPRTGARYAVHRTIPNVKLGLLGWILLAGVIVGLLLVAMIILIPLAILFLLAFVVAAFVVVAFWIVLTLIRLPFRILGFLFRPRVDDGRRNVRIIVRQ